MAIMRGTMAISISEVPWLLCRGTMPITGVPWLSTVVIMGYHAYY